MYRILLPFAFILFFIDIYAFQAIRTAVDSKYLYWLYWFISAATYITLTLAITTNIRTWAAEWRLYIGATLLSIFIFKLLVSIFLLGEDAFRAVKWIWVQVTDSFSSTPSSSTNAISRSRFLSRAAILAAGVPFLALLNGMARNAYNYTIKRVKLPIDNLPSDFEGFKIVQISDIHTGSFLHKEPLLRAINMVNDENADAVFFTGDLVNNLAAEAQDYVPIFGQIKAKHGVFSITGNHDYGDYSHWDNPADKRANFELLKDTHRRMNWQLLLNEHRIIEKNGQKLAILGVENWSAHPRFKKYGNLQKAYVDCPTDCAAKLLLSHDPSHWRAEVLPQSDIHAVFSGHTHGFQFGINLPFFKWSPIGYAYKEWIGLYEENGRFLYVNPGFGYVGYPGRVGFLPELTVFELTRKA